LELGFGLKLASGSCVDFYLDSCFYSGFGLNSFLDYDFYFCWESSGEFVNKTFACYFFLFFEMEMEPLLPYNYM